MAYSLPDGTKIDQVIWDNQNIKIIYSSDYIMVPALYTGRLKIIIIANNTVKIRGTKLLLEDLTEYELKPSIKIDYRNKNNNWLTELFYIQINTATYPKNYIITEFNIPSRFLINRNIYNAYYIKIYLSNLDSSASSGNISGYLIWE